LRSENLSAEFKPVKRLTIKTQGKHGPKVCFDYEGEKLWVPTQKQKATRSYADNPNINFLVRWALSRDMGSALPRNRDAPHPSDQRHA
jgi:hypothetical protein